MIIDRRSLHPQIPKYSLFASVVIAVNLMWKATTPTRRLPGNFGRSISPFPKKIWHVHSREPLEHFFKKKCLLNIDGVLQWTSPTRTSSLCSGQLLSVWVMLSLTQSPAHEGLSQQNLLNSRSICFLKHAPPCTLTACSSGSWETTCQRVVLRFHFLSWQILACVSVNLRWREALFQAGVQQTLTATVCGSGAWSMFYINLSLRATVPKVEIWFVL